MQQKIPSLKIPGYRIEREIGKGGAAKVYLALHELLGRRVALKVMSPALAVDEDYSKRFVREGRTIARLDHPGIVSVYDVAVVDHRPFIAMEYLPRGSLKEKISDPMEPGEVVRVLSEVVDALGHAHSQGVVHRDVKPENILFSENGRAVLTDFGIAKHESSDTALTSVGVVVGTPRYISPEQAQGEACDNRSDLYAVGIMFYEMLTGSPPYDAKGNLSLLYAHINEPIPALPASLSGYQPLLDRLLAKDPDERAESCEEVLSLLQQIPKPDSIPPVIAATVREKPPASERSHRRPRLPVMAATGLTAIVLVTWLVVRWDGLTWTQDPGIRFQAMVAELLEPAEDATTTMQGPEADPIDASGDDAEVLLTGDVSLVDESEQALPTDADEAFRTAEQYFRGDGVERSYTKAFALYQQAAEQGHASAQYSLGVAYGNGLGTSANDELAIYWLEQAAAQGHEEAGYNLVLGRLFSTLPDPEEAAELAQELGEKKYKPAYRILGWMYSTGTGLRTSILQSVRWGAKSIVGAPEPNLLVNRWQEQLDKEFGNMQHSQRDRPT